MDPASAPTSPPPGPTAAEGHHDERQLADAIRRGLTRRPEQAFGAYYHGRRASCALGAAYEGLYHLPDEVEGIVAKDLWKFYECLDFVIKACPEGCGRRVALGSLIVHLNDEHRWSRERVADWLASMNLAATPAPNRR